LPGYQKYLARDVILRAAPVAEDADRRKLVLAKKTYIPCDFAAGSYVFQNDAADMVLEAEALLDTGTELQNGQDYSVFLALDGGSVSVVVSLSADAPAGADAGNCLRIGGFHTLCVGGEGKSASGVVPETPLPLAAMTYSRGDATTAHPLSGYYRGDILPAAVWCLNHRPFSEPEGMFYVPTLDFWCDIYNQSGTGTDTRSVFNGAIMRSRQYVDFVEDQFCVKKALLNDEEFAAAMLGSNERTAVAGASEAGATTGGAGGRKDTAGRRMISIYGAEEGCGSLWQWLATTSASGGSGWTTQNGGKGDFGGACYVLLAGGGWGSGADCGSRCRSADGSRAYSYASIGGRGRSRPMRIIAY
jgi:hypothetical protein